MTGVVKSDYSPKKGKENKNISNHIPVPSTVRKNAKNEAKSDMTPKKEKVDRSPVEMVVKKLPADKKSSSKPDESVTKVEEDNSSSTSNRTIRPQTKILRRPTPNLNHPVILVDSDDSSADSSSGSEKNKDDNPKRLKMGNENSDPSLHNKRKNFIMYNKNNVDKNTKNAVKERTSATLVASIPNPCTSCNRSQAPERLHSHARKDARGLMARRSPAVDVKMTSPQKKPLDNGAKDKGKIKEVKSSPSSPSCSKLEGVQNTASADSTPILQGKPSIKTANKKLTSDTTNSAASVEPKVPPKDFVEPLKACYICEKEFKVSELLLHESKCLEVRTF